MTDLEKINIQQRHITDLEAKLAKSESALADIRTLILDDEAQDPYFTTECFLEHLEDYKHAYEKLSRIEEIEAKLAKVKGELTAARRVVEAIRDAVPHSLYGTKWNKAKDALIAYDAATKTKEEKN